jgi:hypothetical protein
MIPQQGVNYTPQQAYTAGMVPQQMGMNPGMVPMGGMTMSSSPHLARPSVVATKHVILPVSVSSHHIGTSSDVEYDIEITIEEYFPDGSKAEHKHKMSQSFTNLKKINDAVQDPARSLLTFSGAPRRTCKG